MPQHTKEPEYPLSVISNLAKLIVADLTNIMPLGTDECDSMQEDIDAAIRKAEKIVESVNVFADIADPATEIALLRQGNAQLLGVAMQFVRYCQQWQSSNGPFPCGDGRSLILRNTKAAINKTTKE